MKKSDKIARVKVLQERRENLTESEELEYQRLNGELSGYPPHMFSKEYGARLDGAISKADELIRKYSK